MKSINHNILIWIIVLLTLSNLSIVGTIIYKVNFQKKENNSLQVEIPNQRLGRFFRKQLNLSYEQHQEFRKFRQKFHREANKITFKMRLKRKQMLIELSKEQSDTVKLHKLAKDLGVLHEQLKHCTFEYYLNMKSVCNEKQKEKLFEIFKSMMNQNGELNMPSRMKNNFSKSK
ncbi:MAG: periplasmic heavy metal sensor [Bacteroidales bacterium]|nr:periplasmic heavy metal sensor [Bacteroidales bacterium]